MTDFAQGSYGQAWTALTELYWEACTYPVWSSLWPPQLPAFDKESTAWKAEPNPDTVCFAQDVHSQVPLFGGIRAVPESLS